MDGRLTFNHAGEIAGSIREWRRRGLTLQAVGVEQFFAFLVALDATLAAFETLPGDAPEETFAFVAVSRVSERAEFEIVRSRQRNGIDQRLQSLLIYMCALQRQRTCDNDAETTRGDLTSSSSLRFGRPMALGTPAERLPTEEPYRSEASSKSAQTRSYHVETEWNHLASFGNIRCTVDAIVEGIVALLFAVAETHDSISWISVFHSAPSTRNS